jgi:putative Flp pilus-assembly TadE/G-like protein
MRREHGQAAALSVLFLTVLLLSAAAVVDVGSWMREDRDTQHAADAAALAGAQALPEDQGAAQALAVEYGGKNGGGVLAADVSFSTTVLPGDTISVDVDRPADSFFAKIVGIESVEVGSTAKARAGIPSEARWAAPIAVDKKHPLLNCNPILSCFGTSHPTTLDLEKVGPGAFRLLNLDGSKGGTGPKSLSEWILDGYEGSMPLGQYKSDPGAKFNSSQVKAAMGERIGTEMLFPVYRTIREQGANFEYEVIGWVGFYIDDFEAKGNGGKVFGHFTRVIWEGLLPTNNSGSTDFGVRSVALID